MHYDIKCQYICFLAALLHQVNNYRCLEDTVTYSCVEEQGGLIIVDISSHSGTGFTASFSRLSTRNSSSDNIQSSLIRMEILHKNHTYISSIITITNVMNLKSYLLTCNDETLSLNNSVTSYYEGIYMK